MALIHLLDRLEGVRNSGAHQYQAKCPAHEDRSPSLAIREADDGKVLLHCFGGCSVREVLLAVGLDFEDLYPEKAAHSKGNKRPFPAAQVLKSISHEVTVVAVGAQRAVDGKLTQTDKERLMLANQRIREGLLAAGFDV